MRYDEGWSCISDVGLNLNVSPSHHHHTGEELIRAVQDDLGWLLPTDVQDEAIPLILGGGDVMAAAETGKAEDARLHPKDPQSICVLCFLLPPFG